MTTDKLRAVTTAFLLGTAAIGASTFLATVPAYAAGVRAEVGKPLQDAQALAATGNYKGAMEKVNEADAVANKTPDEVSIIAQMKQYIGAKSGDVSLGGAAAAKTKLVNDYNAKNYAGVIADADAMGAGADLTTKQVVAQSYYLSGNKAGCVKYIKSNFGSEADEATLQLQMKCAYDSNDDATQRNVLEELVTRTGKPEYWTQLLKMAEQAKNLSDPQSLQLARLRYLTGTLAGKDDYTNMAQLDMQLGMPAEASTVLDKGTAAGLLNDDRAKKLQAIAKQQAAQVTSGIPAAMAAANKDPGGDALVKVCLQQYSAGQAKDAIATCKSAMGKPLKDKDGAVIALGLTQIAAGQNADAVKTLNADTGNSNGAMIAHMYALYGGHPSGAAVAAAAPPKKKK